ncbi:LacI family transcriptional regulator [Luteolibacter flavescens]|uniref:LacI family transcriptional regulator n=1 Tax=Luteolibacter flavescens TaxID=1859460 RepID=A0ABT3FRI4_9BACT|nr:LacI family DNA-binding transcriptional regulator [Luteolibacter flavescens]MCW1885814.1 LacI family transcriptional regulator [Luteolibacter flavescens]
MIADRLGISRATVSRCFTNHAGISPVTRAKVFQIAAELGYSHMETRVRTTKQPASQITLCALICTEKKEYFSGGYESPGAQILEGVSEYAQLHGALVEVHFIPPDVKSVDGPEFDRIRNLGRRKTSGVLLIYPFPVEVVDELATRVPLVSLVDQYEHNAIDCVDVDHYQGISMLIDHLTAAGHRRIGFYTRSYQVEAGWSFRRYGAFMEKMTRLKLPVDPRDVIGVYPGAELPLEKGIDAAAERTRSGVTAWICAADHQGYDLIAGLKKRGLKVPADVSVTGFDGIERRGNRPALTTVEIPFREIGVSGTQRLTARLRKRFHQAQHVYISGRLREGTTVGTPS